MFCSKTPGYGQPVSLKDRDPFQTHSKQDLQDISNPESLDRNSVVKSIYLIQEITEMTWQLSKTIFFCNITLPITMNKVSREFC